jgi:energy-coupling factor transporter transmembrane protein EcfT
MARTELFTYFSCFLFVIIIIFLLAGILELWLLLSTLMPGILIVGFVFLLVIKFCLTGDEVTHRVAHFRVWLEDGFIDGVSGSMGGYNPRSTRDRGDEEAADFAGLKGPRKLQDKRSRSPRASLIFEFRQQHELQPCP